MGPLTGSVVVAQAKGNWSCGTSRSSCWRAKRRCRCARRRREIGGKRGAMAEIELYEAMRTLRAVRRLRPDPVPDDVLRRVLDAACQAPTGGNRQPFRMIVVRDRAAKPLRIDG